MILDSTSELSRKEISLPKNVRYIGYKLLQSVRFADQPVVPKILREAQNEVMDYFEVENLPGMDLADFLNSSVDIQTKLLVMRHIVRQLQEIDRSGFVLFDRKEDNIRVCSGNPNHISVRQTDIEDIYDKVANAVYSFDNQASYEQMIDNLKAKEIDTWTPSILKLSHAVLAIPGLKIDMKSLFLPFNKISRIPVKKNVLQSFEDTIEKAIQLGEINQMKQV